MLYVGVGSRLVLDRPPAAGPGSAGREWLDAPGARDVGRVRARHAGRLRELEHEGDCRRDRVVRPAAGVHRPRASARGCSTPRIAARAGSSARGASGCTRARSTGRPRCAPTRGAGWRSTTSASTRRCCRTSGPSRGRARSGRGRDALAGRRQQRDRLASPTAGGATARAPTERLLDALREFAGGEDEVVVVLDAGPAEWAGRDGAFEVAIAPRRGPRRGRRRDRAPRCRRPRSGVDPRGHLRRRARRARARARRRGRRRGRVPAWLGY